MSVGSNAARLYPRLDTRKPRPASPTDEDMPSPSDSGTASEESSTEETPEPAAVVFDEPQTRMQDESSEDESFLDVKVSGSVEFLKDQVAVAVGINNLTNTRTCRIALSRSCEEGRR